MILVIPLRNDNRYDQLRFALRSITKHHNIIDCILVGGKPLWYTGTHIPHKDYGPVFKEANIRDKVLAAAQHIEQTYGNVSIGVNHVEFLFANDDHILIQPLATTYNKGLLSETLSRRTGNGSYTRMLRNTFEHYGDVLNTDCHCPMIMNTEGVKKTNFEWPAFGIGFKTCYAQENKVPSEFMEDYKTSNDIPLTRQWFSITDNFPLQKLVALLPEKGKFEV